MTKKEAAIVMAYTGIILGDFSTFHGYAEQICKRSIYTHEFANKELSHELKEKSKNDFINLNVE